MGLLKRVGLVGLGVALGVAGCAVYAKNKGTFCVAVEKINIDSDAIDEMLETLKEEKSKGEISKKSRSKKEGK